MQMQRDRENDEDCLVGQEGSCCHRGADCNGQNHSYDVEKCVGCCFSQFCNNEAFTKQVAEHEHGDQRSNWRQENVNDDADNDRECNLFKTGYITRLFHHDLSFVRVGEHLHDWRLDERHQCHVGVCCNGNLRKKMWSQFHGGVDSHRAVCAADDADGSSFAKVEAEAVSADQGNEDAEVAAAPRITRLGFAIIGPKSVIAPTPRKMSGGRISCSTP